MKHIKQFESTKGEILHINHKNHRDNIKEDIQNIEDIFCEFVDSKECRFVYDFDYMEIFFKDNISWGVRNKCANIDSLMEISGEVERSLNLIKRLKTPLTRLDHLGLIWSFCRYDNLSQGQWYIVKVFYSSPF